MNRAVKRQPYNTIKEELPMKFIKVDSLKNYKVKELKQITSAEIIAVDAVWHYLNCKYLNEQHDFESDSDHLYWSDNRGYVDDEFTFVEINDKTYVLDYIVITQTGDVAVCVKLFKRETFDTEELEVLEEAKEFTKEYYIAKE